MKNTLKFWSVHEITNTSTLLQSLGSLTLQESQSIHDFINVPKIEFIFEISESSDLACCMRTTNALIRLQKDQSMCFVSCFIFHFCKSALYHIHLLPIKTENLYTLG